MLRAWIVRFAPVLLFILLVACQREKNDLVLLTLGGAGRDAMERAVQEFEQEHPGINVQVVTTPGQDYYVKSLTMLAGRAHVDVLWMGQGFGVFAGRGALLDLTSLIAEDRSFDLSDYNQEVVDWYRLGDGLYGIPYGVDVLAIAYNKDIFDAAGVPYPDPDWTVEEMLAKAKQLTRFNKTSGRTEVAGLGFEELNYRYYGLSLLSPDQQHFALNTDLGREWMRRNVKLIYDDRVLVRGSDMESMDRLAGFINQQVAMIEVGTWDIPQARSQAPFRWDVVGMPIGKGGQRTAWASSAGFCIARNTKHPKLAWELLKKLTGPEFQRAMADVTIPTIKGLEGVYLAAHPAPPESLSELVRMQNHMQPNARVAAFQEVEAEWIYWRDQALLRKIPVDEALREAASHINRILELHRKESPAVKP